MTLLVLNNRAQSFVNNADHHQTALKVCGYNSTFFCETDAVMFASLDGRALPKWDLLLQEFVSRGKYEKEGN